MTIEASDYIESNAEVELPQGTIRYRDHGQGPPIVFIHGLLVDGSAWRKVLAALATDHRCIAPDWPLGSHHVAMSPTADLSAWGIARLVADFLAALELDGVTLVGNDTGGGIAHLVAAAHAERVGGLVLTNCDAYEDCPPFPFKSSPYLFRVPGAAWLFAQTFRLAGWRRLTVRMLTKRPVPDPMLERWFRPGIQSSEIRRDATKLVVSLASRPTLEAAERLRHFDRPVLVAWAPEDRFFKLANARRLAQSIPKAQLELVDDSKAFVHEDQPERLAELMRAFIHNSGSKPVE